MQGPALREGLTAVALRQGGCLTPSRMENISLPAKLFTKGVNHRAKRKGRFKARFKEGSDSATGRAGGRTLERQGRKSNCFSARKGCAEVPRPTESAREECVWRDADYQQGSSQLDPADTKKFVNTTEDGDSSMVQSGGKLLERRGIIGRAMLTFTCSE